jgi:hypothetical protein
VNRPSLAPPLAAARAPIDPPPLRRSKTVAAVLLQGYARQTEPGAGDDRAAWHRLRARLADAGGRTPGRRVPAAAERSRPWLLGGLISATLGLFLLLGRAAPLTTPFEEGPSRLGRPGGTSGLREGDNRGTGGMEGASGAHGSGGTA